MKTSTKVGLGIMGAFVLLCFMTCGSAGLWYKSTYNELVASSTAADQALSNLGETYRRRADLIENLVESVKSEVGAETGIVTEYTHERAQMGGQIKLTPEALKDPKAMEAFKTQQGSLGNFLGRLMSFSEKIPNPNFSRSYHDLRVSLDGTNNRIGIAIKDYNSAVAYHNNLSQGFFTRFVAGSNAKFGVREFYKVEEEKKAVPKLKDMHMDMRTPAAPKA